MDCLVKTSPPLLKLSRYVHTISCGFIVLVTGLYLSALPQAWAAEEKAAIPQPIASVKVSASQLE